MKKKRLSEKMKKDLGDQMRQMMSDQKTKALLYRFAEGDPKTKALLEAVEKSLTPS